MYFETLLQPEDRAQLETMLKATDVFHPDEILVALELFDAKINRTDPSYQFLWAKNKQGKLLGYTCFGEIPLTQARYDLYWIAVDPSAQQQGVGRSLLQKTCQQILSQGGVKLYAETSGKLAYQAAQAFYVHNGFEQVVELKDFYEEDDSKLIFEKRLL